MLVNDVIYKYDVIKTISQPNLGDASTNVRLSFSQFSSPMIPWVGLAL
jgi:hypothetical protein